MFPFLFFCFLFLCIPSAWAGPNDALTVTLPEAGTYAYWVQGTSGAIFVLPTRVTAEKFTVERTLKTGDVLYVLDSHTGEVAIETIVGSADGPKPVTLKVADFKSLTAATTPVLPPPAPAPATPAPAVNPPPGGNRLDHLVTGMISFGLAGGIFWLLAHLVRTRGQPLLQVARKAGVAVPDPTPISEDTEATVIYTPPRRALETIPDEAGSPVVRGPVVPLSGVPSLVGLQGLAAGSTFALTEGEWSIGRDGDNEIVLAENTVSRRHARLVRERQGQFTLTDQGSANGVYVNGMKVQRVILKAGDEIKIGDNYFRFHM